MTCKEVFYYLNSSASSFDTNLHLQMPQAGVKDGAQRRYVESY
jgi:hypothetical protein